MEQQNPSPKASPDAEIARLRELVADLSARVAALERAVSAGPPISGERNDSGVGLTVINRIGAVTLIAGIVFFFKYAADNQWIDARELVVLGLAAAFALIGVGEWMRRKGQQTFGQGLAGCGFATLYISAYSAFAQSRLISRETDFFALFAASVFAIALSFRFASSAVAAVGFTGGFIAPLLLRAFQDGVPSWMYATYLPLLGVLSVATVARLYRGSASKSALFLAAFNALWAILAAWILLSSHQPTAFVVCTVALAGIHFGAAYFARRNFLLSAVLYCCGHGCFLTAAMREIEIRTTNQSSLASELDSVFLAFYAVATIVSALLRRSTLDRWLGVTLIGIVVAKLYLYDVWLLTRFYRITAFIALGVLLLLASYLYSRFKSRAESGVR